MGVKINYLPECCIGLGSVLLLIQLSSTQNAGPLLRTIRAGLASRAGRLVGWFSYSLYLLHFVVISGVNSAAISAGVSPSTRTILLLVVAPALSLFLAYVFAWMFEYRLTPKSKRST
jgi:peptidoglycan/LPS O-acetylase OafA/YrhL